MNYLQKKKLAFMSIVNSVKGFIRTVFGVPPLTLSDCVDTDIIINCSIEGNSVQDGTPTPEAPVAVESVGDLTPNLFNPDWLEQGGVNDSGALNTNTNRIRTELIPLETGNYYIRIFTYNNLDLRIRGIHIYNYETENWGSYTAWSNIKGKNFTISTRCKVRFIFQTNSNNVITVNDVRNGNPMLALSKTAVNYEPFGKYKIPVVCGGKNMLSPAYLKQGSIPLATGIPQSSTTRVYMDLITLETGAYYMSISKYNNLDLRFHSIHFYNYETEEWEGYTSWNMLSNKRFTITTRCKARVLILTPSNDVITVDDVKNGNPILALSETATDYEPYVEPVTTNIYLDEPLRKIGDYADYVDFENQKVIRNIYEKVLTGTEPWTAPVETVYCISRGYIKPSHDYSVRTNVLCNHLRPSDSNNIQGCGVSSSNLIVNYDNGAMGISAWKQLLKDLYAANTPMIIYYVRAEQEETPLILPKLPTIKGTTVYTIGTTTQPTNMSATYYATSKE